MNNNAAYLFSGHDLERWLLKMMCGAVASKTIQLKHDLVPQIERYWLDILFLNAPFPLNHGLHVCIDLDHTFQSSSGIIIQPITNHSLLSGIGVHFSGMELILTMSAFIDHRFDGRYFAYRPFEFYEKIAGYEKSVILCWKDKADHGTIELTTHEQVD